MALRALMQKYGPAAAISYSSVTLTFFSTIYATLTFGYDPSPFILAVSYTHLTLPTILLV